MRETPSSGSENNTSILTPKRLVMIAALIATTSALVYESIKGEPEKDKQKVGNPTTPEGGRTKTLRGDLPGTLYSSLPDAGTGDASSDTASGDGGTPPDNVQEQPKLTLEEACQNLLDAQDGDEEGAVYQALSDITLILQQDQEMSIYNLDKIADACKITQEQMMTALKTAIEQGNHRVAELVKHLLYKKCRAEEEAFDAGTRQQFYDDLAKCRELPMASPRKECEHGISKEGLDTCLPLRDGTDEGSHKAGACFEPYAERSKKECKKLPDKPDSPRLDCHKKAIADRITRTTKGEELKKACPGKKAAESGLGDFKKIEQIDAEGHANQLVTLRFKILDLSTPLEYKDLETYGEALRNFFYNSTYSNEAIIKAVGLSSMEEFTAMYVYEVTDALRDRGDRYYGVADFFESILELVELLKEPL